MSSPDPDPASDPRPVPPREPQLEDCCGSGCVHCVFDIYQMAIDNYERALREWEARRALHERLGFRKVAHFTEVGMKFGRWSTWVIGSCGWRLECLLRRR